MSFQTITEVSQYTVEVERSKFICHLFPVRTVDEAEAAVAAVRKEHYNATHNVPVYLVGECYKYSDDGEPAGTAAAPILSMLRNEGFDNLCVVVTRYFGGTLLGKGGLVRAYTSAVKEALAHTRVSKIMPYTRVEITMDYAVSGKVEYRLGRLSEQVAAESESGNERLYLASKTYLEAVVFTVYVTASALDRTVSDIRDLTDGAAEIKILGEMLLTDRFELYESRTKEREEKERK